MLEPLPSPPKIAVVGLGEFGSSLVSWILSGKMNVEVLYCIEPDPLKHRTDLPCYTSLGSVPSDLMGKTEVVVDCATKGCGESNIGLYRELGIPAVFQNGEATSLCELFYSPSDIYSVSPYLKIARCSALTTCAVARPLQKLVTVDSIWASHFKVNARDHMLDMNYSSGMEVRMLLGIPTRVDVVYLRGTSHNGYVYHGVVQLKSQAWPSRDSILSALRASEDIVVVSQNIDSISYLRTTKTLVIEEGVEIDGFDLRVAVLSFTPEINFPQNEAAIRLLRLLAKRKSF